SYLTDPHHGVWHSFLGPYKYNNWDYDYNFGFVFASEESKDTLHIIKKLEEKNNYIVGIRYFSNELGGKIILSIGNRSFDISTKSKLNRFRWILFETKLEEGYHNISISNLDGRNAINAIFIIPKNDFEILKRKIENNLKYDFHILYPLEFYVFRDEKGDYILNLTVLFDGNYTLISNSGIRNIKDYEKNMDIDLNKTKNIQLVSGNYLVYFDYLYNNLIDNPSFEKYLINRMPINWYTKNETFDIYEIYLDNSTKIHGNYSLSVIVKNSLNNSWSWIKTDVKINSSKSYTLEANIKCENIMQVHVGVDAYLNKSTFRITNVPYGFDCNSLNWTKFADDIVLYKYENISTISIILNAGWKKDDKKNVSIAWFDDLKLYEKSVKPFLLLSMSKRINKTNFGDGYSNIKYYLEINPTLWKVYVNSTEPFMLSFAESYDPGWEARVYKNGKKVETVKSIPLYGVINGFWINTTGEDLEIVIRYKPQDYFEFGFAISGITFTSCIAYLIYDWKKDFFDNLFEKVFHKKYKYKYRPRKN
ncbi:MAG: hypothetical protein N2169_06685, partial [bacterium]|nr:hypothetical protein [bacterium]